MVLCIEKVLRKCDMFGQNIQLSFKNKEQYRTSFGGIVSLLVIIFLVIILYNKIFDLFQKNNFKITVQENFLNDAPEIILGSDNFLLAFIIEENESANFKPFNISVIQKSVNKTISGRNKQASEIKIEQCNRNHFSMLGLDEKFHAYNYDKYLCVPLNQAFQLQGSYESDIFSYIEIVISPCQSSNCNMTLNSNQIFKFKIITSNVQINPSFKNPIQQTLFGNDFYFTFQPYSTVINADIFIRNVQYEENESIIPYYNSIRQDQLIQLYYEDIRQNQILSSNSTYFSKFFLRSHSKTSIISKQYQQLDEYFAYLGGLIRIAFGLIAFVIVEYNRCDLFLCLANRLYNFQLPGMKQNPYENVMKKINTIANSIASKLQKKYRFSKSLKKLKDIVEKYGDQGIPMSEFKLEGGKKKKLIRYDQCDIVEVQTRESFLDYVYLEVANHTMMIKMRFKYLISRWTNRYLFYNDPYIQLIDTAIKKIQSHLNIQQMINNFQCYDRMKEVVLNQEQKKLIEFVPKPIIKGVNQRKLKDKKSQKKQKFSQVEMFDKVENLKELFRAYKKLYRSKEILSLREKDTNDILFNMLGQELREIFEFTMHLNKQSNEQEENKQILIKVLKKQKDHKIESISDQVIEERLNTENKSNDIDMNQCIIQPINLSLINHQTHQITKIYQKEKDQQ